MTETAEATGRDSLGGTTSPLLGPIRLGIGLLQGFALFALHRAADNDSMTWPATEPLVFGPLLLLAIFLPVVLLAGVGRLRPITLAVWTVVAGVALVLLGLHDIARQSAETLRHSPFLSPPVILFSGAALFIAHHLVAAANLEHRRVPAFAALFDTTSKAVVQLALSLGFTGAFWILLHLGSALFKVIGLDFLEDLLREDWFAIPVTFVVFATAVHLTDVRDGLIRGVRTVGLMLLSWLLLVMTVLAAGFLAALPFTGLDGLWETGNATSLVLAAAAAVIILINTAYQDGRPDNRPPVVLRVAVRLAAVLLTPLVIIAVWGLAMRIGQYGLTPDRIIAAACALIGASFAAGYGWAALSPFWRKGDWMRPLEPVTIWTAVLAVAVILLLFSPVLDPARLSVMDQVARLERGAVAPDKFDYRFLRFESGKAGQAALARLTRSSDPVIGRNARRSSADNPADEGSSHVKPDYEVVPRGAVLPAGFAGPVDLIDVRAQCEGAEFACVVSPVDLNDDGSPEVLLANGFVISLWTRNAEGRWASAGYWDTMRCAGIAEPVDTREALRNGAVRSLAAPWPDLEFAGTRSGGFRPENDCTAKLAAQMAPAD